ncbi:MAG: aspartate ammonia-lyase, partial [Rhodobacteraceae bacterium]|nr:aspartate ammonia-lyase [Paracoccaceae bacterium]
MHSGEIAMRIERDSLGEFEVPAEAKYGVHSMRAYKNFFISGVPVSEFPELVIALAQVKKAAAAANTKLGVLDAERARAIQDACDEIIGGAH